MRDAPNKIVRRQDAQARLRGEDVRARPWWWDALAALAFFGQAFFLGKAAVRFMPILGLLFFFANFGLGYFFARAAWRGLLAERDS